MHSFTLPRKLSECVWCEGIALIGFGDQTWGIIVLIFLAGFAQQGPRLNRVESWERGSEMVNVGIGNSIGLQIKELDNPGSLTSQLA